MNCYLLFKQQDVETQAERFFHLSETESVTLRKLKTGTQNPYSQAIIRGPIDAELDITASPREREAIENEQPVTNKAMEVARSWP